MIVNHQVDLSVSLGGKDAASAQGARWDMDRPARHLQSLQKRLPRDLALTEPVEPAVSSQSE